MKYKKVKLTKYIKMEVLEDTQFVLDFGQKVVRTAAEPLVCELIFNRPGVTAELVGLYKLGKDTLGNGEKLDFVTIANHQVPNTSCQTTIKGVLLDGGESSYTGKIKIAKEAQQTSSFLHDAVLVAGENTKNRSDPMLEIEADDVKASHGASTGRIDENQLYYLQSRGLTKAEATKIILEGFFESLLSKIGDEGIKKDVRKAVGLS